MRLKGAAEKIAERLREAFANGRPSFPPVDWDDQAHRIVEEELARDQANAAIRNAVLEEAALACEKEAEGYGGSGMCTSVERSAKAARQCARNCASAVRALKARLEA